MSSDRRGGPGGWWRWLAVAAVVSGLLVLAAVTLAPLAGRDGLLVAANRAQLTGGFVLPAVLAVVAVLGWARQRTTPTPEVHRAAATAVAPAGTDHAATVLAQSVKVQWKREALLRSLDDPDPIPVRWRTRPALSDHTASIYSSRGPDGPATADMLEWEASSGDVAGLVERFRDTRRRRLVLVGGPGSGKTTLAVQLLLHLLDAPQPGEPVPVLLPIADWDTVAFPRLHDWLTDRISRDYPALRSAEFDPRVVHTLTADSRILPVLDGLDELPPAARSTVILALNRSLGGDDQLIITSRTTEYTHATEAAGDVITSALVLRAHPLPPQAAAGYLQTCLPPRLTTERKQAWDQILTDLRTTRPRGPAGHGTAVGKSRAVLADIAATPLGVWLLRTVYTDLTADLTDLTNPDRFPDPAALRSHLFDQLIPARIKAHPPSDDPAEPFRPRRLHDPDDTRRWLTYLATLLTHPRTPEGQPRTRDLAWWHLARHTPRTSLAGWLTFGLAGGLEFGLAVGLAGGLVGGLASGLSFGLAAGLSFGLSFGPSFGLTFEDWTVEEPGFADLNLRTRSRLLLTELKGQLAGGLAVGLAGGLAFGIVFGVAGGLAGGIVFGVAGGLAVGLTVVVTSGITSWMEIPASAEQASTPLSNWRGDRTLNLARTSIAILVVALALGLTIGLAGGLVGGLASGLAFGLVAGLVGGLTGGVTGGEHHAWLAYVITAKRLAHRSVLPRDLMGFLDDAHRLGLLRAVGPVYQFRHAELQDHLASSQSSRPSVS